MLQIRILGLSIGILEFNQMIDVSNLYLSWSNGCFQIFLSIFGKKQFLSLLLPCPKRRPCFCNNAAHSA